MSQSSPRRFGVARRPLFVSACGLVAAAGLLAEPHLAGQTFRASVDLIAVDVQVTDRAGRAIAALSPDKFAVTLDGKKRRVVSADLAQYAITPLPTGPSDALPTMLPPSAPLGLGAVGNGRTFIIAIDTTSFRNLDSHVAVLAAERFTRRLQPDDAIGIFTLPNGPYVEPTTSHASVRQALSKIVGRKPAAPSQFDMSIEQMIDITAAAANLSILASRTTVGRMVSSSVATPTSTDVVSDTPPLDCAGTTVACTESAIAEAAGLATVVEEEVMQGLLGLQSLLRQLEATPIRKTVLLLSAGMPVSDRSGGRPSLAREVRLLGEQAAYANATIHTLYFDPNLTSEFALDARRPRPNSGRSRVINTRALAEFTEPSGGALVEVSTGAGEDEIDKLVGQISTYYVLGVEPDARDRDGRPHRLQVKVGQSGVSLRSRQLVIVPRPPK